MARLERLLNFAAAIEAALLAYAALIAFLTPSTTQERNFLLTFVLLVLATPLTWHAVDAASKSLRCPDPLVLRVMIPNFALLYMCLGGSLLRDGSSGNILLALVACAAVAMIVGAIGLSRARLGAGPELDVAGSQG